MYEKNYELLANAIVIQAAKDYRRAKSFSDRNEIKRFFLSDWFKFMTDVDGRKLLRKLDRERTDKKKRRSKSGGEMSIVKTHKKRVKLL